METRVRSLAKATAWQTLGLAVTGVAGWLLTGSAVIGGALAAINTVLGFAFCLVHERLWATIRWGRADV